MQTRDRKRDQENPELVLSGKNALVEAIRQGREMEKVFVQDKLRGEVEKEIRHLARDYNIPLVKVPAEKLNQMV
ncbi:MAG TPA: RNA methyltransferase substrate-binding domain-containing protein, partial [Saprospiraceae bacterium]|nr:RNA methyltransferase substrate-binding domain-containing protein [Saprospiraceae bacterium]